MYDSVPESEEFDAPAPPLPPNRHSAATQPAQFNSPLSSLGLLAKLDAGIEPAIFGAPVKYTVEDLAERSGVDLDRVYEMTRWIGWPAHDSDELRYTDADVDAVKHALAFGEAAGLDDAALGALIRGMASSMERLATRQVEAIVQKIANRDNIGDTKARLIAAERTPKQAEMMVPLMDHVYRRHLSGAVRRLTTQAIAQRGLLNDDTDFPLVRAIGFADLVGFTARTERATPAEFTELVQTFRDTCWDIVTAQNGARIINFVGDAVFFVADSAKEGADIALQLAAPGALGICGPVRAGLVWSRVISTYGDVYGPGVNLASRIAAAASPSEVFIGPHMSRLLAHSPEYEVTPQPMLDARGIGAVQVSRLRYADDPRSQYD